MLFLFVFAAVAAAAAAALGSSDVIGSKPVATPLNANTLHVTPGRTLTAYEVDPPTQGLRVWGDNEQDTGATYRPTYIKWSSCSDMMWGFCAKDFLDNLGHQNTPRFQAGYENFMKILAWIFPAADIATWLTKNFCMRFKFRLNVWGDDYGGKGWEVGRWPADQLAVGVPNSPLVKREGWHRVWIRNGEFDSSTRNTTTVQLFFPSNPAYPENKTSIMMELLSTKEIRAMLRLDANVSGAMQIDRLAWAVGAGGCGDGAKFWLATRTKAMKEFS